MTRREKLLLIVPVLLALLVGGGPVIADPVGAVRRIVYTCQTSAPAPINTDRTWVKCSNHHAMRTNTSNVDVDLESGGGGSGMAIGDSVTGATAGRCLFSATGPVLADDAGCTYDAAGNALTLTGSIITPTIGTSGAAQHALPSGTAALATISDASGIAAIYANATATTQNEVALTTTDGPVIWTLGGGMSEMMTWFDSSRDWQYFGIKDGAGAETLYAEGPWDWQTTIPGGYITLENNTPATGPVPIQCGGDIKLEGRCWDGSASRECSGLIASKSETSGAAYTGELDFYVVRNTTTTRVGGFSYNGTTNVFDAVNVTASSSINTPTIGTDASNQHAPPSGSGALCSVDATQTLTNKTLTTPVINGATSASGNFDLSGSTGTFKTTTGAGTLSGDTSMASGKKWTYQGGLNISAGSDPTCATLAAAGTTATCGDIVGNRSDFKVRITAAGTGGAQGPWIDVTYGSTWDHKPICSVTLGSNPNTSPSKLYTFFYDYANSTTTVAKIGLAYGTDFLPPATTLVVRCIDPEG